MIRHLVTGATASVMAAAIFDANPALAQATTETQSFSEQYFYGNFETIEEFGEGSTTQTVVFNTEINGQPVDIGLAGLFRYFDPFSPTEIEQALAEQLPESYVHMVDGVAITVTDWADAEYYDTSYELIDVLYEESYSTRTDTYTSVTVQFTSGDAPDNVVPTGQLYDCYTPGASGATNFEPFDGAFPECGTVESYFTVAPGTINTNTHTDTIYDEVTVQRIFQSIDDGYTDFYTIRPAATLTASSGTLEINTESHATIRNDSFATHIQGTVGSTTVLDETFEGTFGDAAVQSAVETLSRPRAYAASGAPAVIVWSAPARTSSREELVSASTDTETSTQVSEVVTTTTTNGGIAGGEVAIGDRGACSDTGASGATNGEAPTGTHASCGGGAIYLLSPGETNTNTHTTSVTETIITTVTTEHWLNSETYQLSGTPVLVGQIHAAVRNALYRGGGDFARRHGNALAARNGFGFGLWADVFTGKTDSDTDTAGPGSTHSADGVAGGLSFSLLGRAVLGIAVSHETNDANLAGLPESGELSQTQLGLAAGLSAGVWRLAVTAGRGWGEIDTERGGAGIGGVARASYDARTWFASGEAGPEFALGPVTLRPLAGMEWSRATLGEFAESGGIALAGEKDSASRLAATLGAQAAARWSLPGGPGIRLWADARAGQVIDGEERDRAVVFASGPGGVLHVTSASEGDTYAEGRLGVSVFVAGGLGLHLGAEGRTGGGESDWRASAGVSAAF